MANKFAALSAISILMSARGHAAAAAAEGGERFRSCYNNCYEECVVAGLGTAFCKTKVQPRLLCVRRLLQDEHFFPVTSQFVSVKFY